MGTYVNEIVRRKDLLIYLVVSGLKAEHRNSFLGYFWWLLDPLLRVGIYYFLVVFLMNRGSENYGGFLVVGLMVWRWTDAAIKQSSKSILKQSGIISKVYLPKIIFPLSTSITQMVNFGFGLVVIGAYLILSKTVPGIGLLWLPLIMVVHYLFLLAIGLIVSFASVFVRDVEHLLTHFMRLWFYVSPVIWERRDLPEGYSWIVDMNPLSTLLASYRSTFLNLGNPNFTALAVIGLISLSIIGLLTFYYSRNEHKMVKVL